ncbi:unnamed protein product [Blepharisma stoltei]|uniref:Purple acid phosphatase n=1 Tax=Blepharisma stoltei TaxID=1481888 RepID=A0AAU9J883_9CILI|nr:unnamed protein product [Blepharisma stoltei]
MEINFLSKMFLPFILPFLVAGAQASLANPEQIHISWTENEHEMKITWSVFLETECKLWYRPTLCSDTSTDFAFKHIKSQHTKFDEGTWVNRFVFIHTAVLTNLRDDCFYEYYIENHISTSDTYIFSGQTPQSFDNYGNSNNPVKVIIFGDLGTGPHGNLTYQYLQADAVSRNFSAVFHMGDIAYNLESNDGEVGDEFLNMIQSTAAIIPYMTLPGNHENDQNMLHYRMRFNMPKNNIDPDGLFYSLNIGPAHFVFLNTEIYFDYYNYPYDEEDYQRLWLINDLTDANAHRNERPWIIVMTHHPLYCSYDFFRHSVERNIVCGADTWFFRDKFEDIFYEQGVDMFLAGHLHTYERMGPIYKNNTVKSERDDLNLHLNPQATVYMIDGNGGSVIGHNAELSTTPHLWNLYSSNDFGYGRMTVFNKTHLFFEQFSAAQEKVTDTLWLIKTRNRF